MATSEVEELLKDARLVRNYAARAGKLPDDALPNAIAAVEQASTADARPETASLVAALNTAVRAIAPMTLIKLRAGRSPFNTRSVQALAEVFLCVFTIGLMAVAAYNTQLLHQEEIAVKALQQIQDMRVQDKLNTVRRMVERERVLEKRDAQYIPYDQYHRAVSELNDLQEKIDSVHQLARAVAERTDWYFPWPFQWQLRNPDFSQSQPSGAAAAQNTPYDPIADASVLCAQARSVPALSSGVVKEVHKDKEVIADIPWFCGVLAVSE